MTDYPNREHQNADNAAAHRAMKALDEISSEIGILRVKVERRNTIYGSDTNTLTDKVRALTEQFAILETLREVREWHAAGVSAGVLITGDAR